MSETAHTKGPEQSERQFSSREITLMKYLKTAPMHFSWKFMLGHGASLEISICGRWDEADAAKVAKLFGMILEIIEDTANPAISKAQKGDAP